MGIKSINSDLVRFDANANTIDFGLLLVAPVINNYQITDKLSGDFNISLGYALSNFGGELDYGDTKVPLPRMENLGYGLNLGLRYNHNNTAINILNVDFTSEARTKLVSRTEMDYEYTSILSNINLWDNIIAGKASDKVSNSLGWRVSLFDIFAYSSGQRENDLALANLTYESYKTKGFSLETSGILKILKSMTNSSTIAFLSDHINIRYNYAELSDKPIFGGFKYSNNLQLIVKGFLL